MTVEILRPINPGEVTSCLKYPNLGEANWQDVAECYPDDDQTYVYMLGSGTTINASEYYIFPQISDPTPQSIQNVRVLFRAKRIGIGTEILRSSVSLSGVRRHGSIAASLTLNYADYYSDWVLNPVTNLPWTKADLDLLQGGLRIFTGMPAGDEIRVTQVWMEVTYTSGAPPATFILTINPTTNGTTNPIPGTHPYNQGDTATVQAIPNTGYQFDHWDLNGTSYTQNPIAITMNANATLTPYFTAITLPPSGTIFGIGHDDPNMMKADPAGIATKLNSLGLKMFSTVIDSRVGSTGMDSAISIMKTFGATFTGEIQIDIEWWYGIDGSSFGQWWANILHIMDSMIGVADYFSIAGPEFFARDEGTPNTSLTATQIETAFTQYYNEAVARGFKLTMDTYWVDKTPNLSPLCLVIQWSDFPQFQYFNRGGTTCDTAQYSQIQSDLAGASSRGYKYVSRGMWDSYISNGRGNCSWNYRNTKWFIDAAKAVSSPFKYATFCCLANWIVNNPEFDIAVRHMVAYPDSPTVDLTMEPAPNDETLPATGVYPCVQGMIVKMTAYPRGLNTFSRWEVDGVVSLQNPLSLTMDAPHTVKPVFTQYTGTYDLIVTINDPTRGDTTPPPGVYPEPVGSTVSLLATPKAGFYHKSWNVDGVRQYVNPVNIYMDIGHTAQAIFESTTPTVGTVVIVTNPSGGGVHLDTTNYGPAPVTIPNIPAGTYTVSFDPLQGYVTPINQIITVVAGQTTNVIGTYTTTPPTTGSIDVSTNPSGGEIFIDTVSHGFAPKVIGSVPPGMHTVDFGMISGYTKPNSQSVNVVAGQTTTVVGNYTLIPTHSLTIGSTPSGVAFTINGTPTTTPYSQVLPEADYTIVMPITITVGPDTYNFKQWEDGSTNPARMVSLTASMNLMAAYEKVIVVPPTHTLTVESVPTGVPFTINGNPATTPYSQVLDEGSYTIVMPPGITSNSTAYVFSNWEDATTNPTRTINLIGDTPLLATYVIAPPATGTLAVDTIGTPTKGEVLVNDVSWGLAPQSKVVNIGTYTVSFGPIAGFQTPQSQIVDVSENQITSVIATYVAISPPVSIAATAVVGSAVSVVTVIIYKLLTG